MVSDARDLLLQCVQVLHYRDLSRKRSACVSMSFVRAFMNSMFCAIGRVLHADKERY